MDGFLNIWKPSGPTSFDVVRRLRRAGADRQVGHGGTLDPLAEGVLPILAGQATRFAEFLEDCAKAYRARVLLGIETDTLDIQGQVLQERDVSTVTLEDIQAHIPTFVGRILQRPPAYSAIKREGQPLYKLARRGEEVKTEPRPVIVHSIVLASWEPPRLTLEIVCGRGTYIRSIAADLGERLGCGATLEALARLRVGPFKGQEAARLEEAEQVLRQGRGADLFLPLDTLFLGWPSLRLNAPSMSRALSGALLGPEAGEWDHVPSRSEPSAEGPFLPSPPANKAIAYGPDGRLVAVLEAAGQGLWHPWKVLPAQT